jgi:hypothetical protein
MTKSRNLFEPRYKKRIRSVLDNPKFYTIFKNILPYKVVKSLNPKILSKKNLLEKRNEEVKNTIRKIREGGINRVLAINNIENNKHPIWKYIARIPNSRYNNENPHTFKYVPRKKQNIVTQNNINILLAYRLMLRPRKVIKVKKLTPYLPYMTPNLQELIKKGRLSNRKLQFVRRSGQTYVRPRKNLENPYFETPNFRHSLRKIT